MPLPLSELRKRVNSKVLAYENAKAQRHNEKTKLAEEQDTLATLQEAQALAQHVAQMVQEQVHNRIASVVTRSLEAVFDEPYTFKLKFEQKRGRTEAVLLFERDGMEVDPMSAAGGGVVDVAAFALRLSCLLLSRPPVRRLMILDEPFKFVSAEYRQRIRQLVETLAKEMQVQFIMVTHIKELKMGKVVEL